eukprot:6182867-Pleurochrysis_carterae.AAC.2
MDATEDPDAVSKPFWDSSQLYMRTWLDDLAIWLPSQLSDYATLVAQGSLITSQGKVATYDLNHALACRSRLIHFYTFDNPSPSVPQFAFNANNATQPPIGGTGPQARSQSPPSAATSAPGTAPPSASVSAQTTLGTTHSAAAAHSGRI